MAKKFAALVVVDSTFATPIVPRPVEFGADPIVHSVTKLPGGHGELPAGVVTGGQSLTDRIRAEGLCELSGATLAPESAFLLSEVWER